MARTENGFGVQENLTMLDIHSWAKGRSGKTIAQLERVAITVTGANAFQLIGSHRVGCVR